MTNKILAWVGLILTLMDIFNLTEKLEKIIKKGINYLRKTVTEEDTFLSFLLKALSIVLTTPLALILPLLSIIFLDILLNKGVIITAFYLILGAQLSFLDALKMIFDNFLFFLPSIIIIILEISHLVATAQLVYMIIGHLLKWSLLGIWSIFHIMSKFRKGVVGLIGLILAAVGVLLEYKIFTK